MIIGYCQVLFRQYENMTFKHIKKKKKQLTLVSNFDVLLFSLLFATRLAGGKEF